MTITRTLLATSIAAICGAAAAAPAPDPAGVSDENVVIVTASLRNHTAAAAPAFTTVITAEDIARTPVNSIGDLLRETVGINTNNDGTGRDSIQIRGLDGKYTLMLVNGKRVSSSGALWRGGDFDFSSIPLSNIKRVEIVRGPMAALYGSDAIGGVINIITKPATQAWSGNVTADYRVVSGGDEGTSRRIGVSATGAVSDTVSLAVNGDVLSRDAWYSTSAADKTRPARLEAKKAQNLSGSATVQLAGNQSLDIDLAWNHDHRPRGMYYYAFYPAWNFEAKDFREQEIKRRTGGVTHRGDWGSVTTTAFITKELATIDDFNSRYDKPQERVLKEDNTYAKFYGSGSLGSHTITAGIDARRQVIKDALTYKTSGRIGIDSKALFAEDEIALAERLHLTLGGRFDDTSTYGSRLTPKSYLVWQDGNGITVKGGVSKAFKAPEAYQLSKEYSIVSCGGSCYLSGNPDLKPETSTNIEFGVEVHRKGWDLTAAVFHNDVKDLIVAYYDAALPARRWINVAQAKTAGIELQGEVELAQGWSASANFTHLNADYTDENGKSVTPDSRPENMGKVSLNWKASRNLTTTLSAHYTGKQLYDSKELPGYTRVDLGVVAKIDQHWSVRTGVKNLTGVDLEQKNKSFAYNELGRNYYLSATYGF